MSAREIEVDATPEAIAEALGVLLPDEFRVWVEPYNVSGNTGYQRNGMVRVTFASEREDTAEDGDES